LPLGNDVDEGFSVQRERHRASEWTIIKDTSTRNLAFVAGKVDLYSPHNITIPILKDIKTQAPQAICEVAPTNVNRTLIINRDKPPFDNADQPTGDRKVPQHPVCRDARGPAQR
jgi:hypothetical protein